MKTPVPETGKKKRRRYRLLYKMESYLETPMFLLAIIWLVLFIIELTQGLSETQHYIVAAIWILFILEFSLKLFLAPHKLNYIKHNWLTVTGLVVPAFRAFRLLRAIRILSSGRIISTARIVKALTSTRRFIGDIREVQGPAPEPEMNAGVMLALSPSADKEAMKAFAKQLAADVQSPMERSTGIRWLFHFSDPLLLPSEEASRPSDFLDEASRRMAEGPFDLVMVVTDTALISRKERTEPGLASPVSRIVVLSVQRFVAVTRNKAGRSVSSEAVRWNGALLLLHLLGRISGLRRAGPGESKVMAPFVFSENRRNLPGFNTEEKTVLRKKAERLPERELRGGNVLESFIFHVLMAFRHVKGILRPLLRNAAPLLPLSLPGLATAAVAPSFLLVFTAEIWDVGLNMSNRIATIYASASILGASLYLVQVQSLFLPRKEKRVLTEHLAVANTVIFLSILLACIGLFLLVGGLMFLIETWIFPAGLMKTWPTLMDLPAITWKDKLRLAAFISAIGVTTGALAGGLESRKVIRHLALFESKP